MPGFRHTRQPTAEHIACLRHNPKAFFEIVAEAEQTVSWLHKHHEKMVQTDGAKKGRWTVLRRMKNTEKRDRTITTDDTLREQLARKLYDVYMPVCENLDPIPYEEAKEGRRFVLDELMKIIAEREGRDGLKTTSDNGFHYECRICGGNPTAFPYKTRP